MESYALLRKWPMVAPNAFYTVLDNNEIIRRTVLARAQIMDKKPTAQNIRKLLTPLDLHNYYLASQFVRFDGNIDHYSKSDAEKIKATKWWTTWDDLYLPTAEWNRIGQLVEKTKEPPLTIDLFVTKNNIIPNKNRFNLIKTFGRYSIWQHHK